MSTGVGFGFTVAFGTSTYATKCRMASRSNAGREKVDATHSESTNGWEESVPSAIHRAGNLRIEGLCDSQTNPDPPIDQDPETITLTYPDGGTLAGTGYMTSYEESIPYNGMMTFTAEIVFTGPLTFTAAT